MLIDLIQRPVTGGLVFPSIATSLLYWSGFSIDILTMENDKLLFQPWRFLTSVLPHAGLLHLAFNVYWVTHFGMRVEDELGSLRTAALLGVIAVGSSAAQFALFDGGIGLSGVVYGLFGMLWVLSRRDSRFSGVVDGRLTGLFVGWFLLCVALTYAGVWNIANVAHGAGALFGWIAGHAMARSSGHALRWRAALAACFVAVIALASVGRRYVNVGGDMAGVFFQQAHAAAEDEDYEAAAELYRASLRRDENHAATWFNLGLALDQLGRSEEALESFDHATRLDPGDADGHGLRGSCLADLGRFEEALSALDRALQIAPEGWLYAERGRCLGGLERWSEAVDALSRAIELDPENERAVGLRGRYLAELGRYGEALESFDAAIVLDPDDADALASRGWCLAKLGRHQEAILDLNRAVRIAPDSWLHSKRAWCLWELGHQQEALEVSEQAIALDPKDSWALAMHGMYLAELERFEEALGALDQVLELDPDDAWTLGMRGWCLYELDRFQEARRDLSRALELDPEDDFARDLLDRIR